MGAPSSAPIRNSSFVIRNSSHHVVAADAACSARRWAAARRWRVRVSLWRPVPCAPTSSVVGTRCNDGWGGSDNRERRPFVCCEVVPGCLTPTIGDGERGSKGAGESGILVSRISSLVSRPRVFASWRRRSSASFSCAARTASLMSSAGSKAKPSAGRSCVFNG